MPTVFILVYCLELGFTKNVEEERLTPLALPETARTMPEEVSGVYASNCQVSDLYKRANCSCKISQKACTRFCLCYGSGNCLKQYIVPERNDFDSWQTIFYSCKDKIIHFSFWFTLWACFTENFWSVIFSSSLYSSEPVMGQWGELRIKNVTLCFHIYSFCCCCYFCCFWSQNLSLSFSFPFSIKYQVSPTEY